MILLPLAGVLLASALAASFVALLRDVRGRHIAERVAEIGLRAAASRPKQPKRIRSIQVEQREPIGLVRSICRLVKYDPAHPEQYPMPRAFVAGAAAMAFFCGSHVAAMYISQSIALAIGIGCALISARMLFGGQRARYANALLRQLPDVIGGITRASQAGVPIGEALRSVVREASAPTRDEFARVLRETALGGGLDVAIARLHRRTGLAEYSFLAVALGMQAQAGGSIAETLENLADMVRKRIAVSARARALAGEARTSAFILGGMPFVCAFAIYFLRPGYLDMFFTTDIGNRMLTLSGALITVGVLVIRWIISRSTAA